MSQPESYVGIGTPFELPENEDDFSRKKPVPIHEQVAVDVKGRRRFHGAFTGGFSAGHFNSVGSIEGWTPKDFSSSKAGRADKYQQRPEDFMDDEDLGEFGIAPKRVSTRQDFTHPEHEHAAVAREETQRNVFDAHHQSIIPGVAPLHDLVIPASQTIGARLLKKMGWREGQGVGPKQQRSKESDGFSRSQPLQTKGESSSAAVDSASKWAFSPRDVDVAEIPALVGRHGLGYKGMDASRTSVLQNKMRANPSSKLRIAGQAFGVGAYEVEDADVYDVDDMVNYDQTMGASDHADPFFGWSGSHDQHLDGGESLSAFAKARRPVPPRQVFHAPDLPRDFKPYHHFKDGPKKSASEAGLVEKSMTSTVRGQLLGESRLQDMSVMSLLSVEDRSRLAEAKQHQTQSPAVQVDKTPVTKVDPPLTPTQGSQSQPRVPVDTASRTAAASAALASRFSSSMPASGPGHFKPYASNPEKQKRYEAVASGQAYVRAADMMEWEEQREREEFARAAQLYRPLGGAMAARFTPAKGNDNEPDTMKEEVLAEHVADPSDQMSAARANMFGRLTRTTLEWHPDRVVCKRFNVPDPFPNSNFVGLLTNSVSKKANFLNMDFLSAQSSSSVPIESAPESPPNVQPADAKPADAKVKETSAFVPVVESPSSESPAKSGVSFQISTEPMKPRSRPPLTGPLAVLNKPRFVPASERLKAAAGNKSGNTAAVVSSGKEVSTATQPVKDSSHTVSSGVTEVPMDTSEKAKPSSAVGEDVTGEPERPSIDFFKAIFASDSEADEADSSSDEEAVIQENLEKFSSLDNQNATPPEETPNPASTSISGSPPRHLFVPRKQRQQSPAEEDEEEFGPALPPPVAEGRSNEDGGYAMSAPVPWKATKSAHKDKKHKKKQKKKEKKVKKSKSKKSRSESHHRQDSFSESSSEEEMDRSSAATKVTDRVSSPAVPGKAPVPAPVPARPRAADFM